MSSEEQKGSQQPTLTEFIEKNHKLISTAGVLATLSVLANKLPENQLGSLGKIISLLMFFLVLLICLEVFGNFPYTEKGKIYLFREAFTLIVLLFIMLWVATFYSFLLAGLLVAVFALMLLVILALCATGIRKLVLKISWFKGLKQQTKEQIIPIFGAMAVMTIGYLILRHFKFFWRH